MAAVAVGVGVHAVEHDAAAEYRGELRVFEQSRLEPEPFHHLCAVRKQPGRRRSSGRYPRVAGARNLTTEVVALRIRGQRCGEAIVELDFVERPDQRRSR